MLFYLNIYVQLSLGLFSVYLFNIQHLDLIISQLQDAK